MVPSEVIATLPALPQDRSPAEATGLVFTAFDVLSKTDNATYSEDLLVLDSHIDDISWGLWEMPAGDALLLDVDVQLGAPPGNFAWVAIANYSTAGWDIRGPISEATDFALDDINNRSPGDNCYVAIITSGGNTASMVRLILNVDASGWQIVTIDSEGDVGAYTSLAVVDGNPAISYQDVTQGRLKYARSSSATGAQQADWLQTATVDYSSGAGEYTSLAVVDGNPAISYHDTLDGDLKYARSTTSTGIAESDWSHIVAVDSDLDAGWYTSLAIVDGNPAISYGSYEPGFISFDLMYARSTTASGADSADWSQIVIVFSAGDVGQGSSLAVVDGNPAISFYDYTNGDLLYARSTTTTGALAADWSQVVTVDSDGDAGWWASLAVVDGNPAISYSVYSGGDYDLKYARSTTATGAAALDWSQLVTVHALGSAGQDNSLSLIAGQPAVSYYDDGNQTLRYTRASNSTGEDAGSWLMIPMTVDDTEGVGLHTSIAEVGGRPAISYYDLANGDLKYAILLE